MSSWCSRGLLSTASPASILGLGFRVFSWWPTGCCGHPGRCGRGGGRGRHGRRGGRVSVSLFRDLRWQQAVQHPMVGHGFP